MDVRFMDFDHNTYDVKTKKVNGMDKRIVHFAWRKRLFYTLCNFFYKNSHDMDAFNEIETEPITDNLATPVTKYTCNGVDATQ